MKSTSKPNASKRTIWAVRILAALVSLPFAMSGIMKVAHSAPVVQGFTAIGIPEGVILPLGILELACLALFLIPRTAVLGTFFLTGYLGGAVLANIVIHSDVVVPLAIGLMAWACTSIRVPELRMLLPLRRSGEALQAAEPREAVRFVEEFAVR